MAQRFSSPIKSQTGAKPQVQSPKGYEDYLKTLDELLKRNTGTGLFVGQDTSSNLPFYMPGKVVNQAGLADTNPSLQPFTAPKSALPDTAPIQTPVDQQMTAEEFLKQFNDAINNPQNQPPVDGIQPGQDQINYSQGMASTPDGGVINADGTIQYPDGSTRKGDPAAYAIQSLPDGSLKYSDGSIRKDNYAMGSAGLDSNGRQKLLYNDQSIRFGDYLYQDGQPINTDGGLQGLETGLFGQTLPTTQPYGNYNRGMGYANNRHQAIDLRTRDLQGEQRNFKLPVDAEVVQVITADSGSPYGNSILFRLPSGEMLRFSHMSQIANVQPGQTIQAGQVFGMPGSTGNSTAEHLDLEYYNPQGKVDSPANFSGFTNPQGLKTPLPNQPAPGTVITPAPQQAKPQGQILGATDQISSPVTPKKVKSNPFINPAVTTANAIDTANPTGNFDMGITEMMRNQPEQANQKQLQTVENLHVGPDIGSTERARAQGTNVFRQFAGDLIDEAARKTGIRTDFGLSELIAGGKTKNTDQGIVTKASASEINPMSRPGQGVASLASSGAGDLQNVFKSQQPQEQRAIGDVKGTVDSSGNPMYSSLQDTAQSRAGLTKNDIRDSFFKMGGAEMYSQYLKPGIDANYNGALNMDLFNDNFYQDLGNITSVFGGSKDIGAATQKFVEFEKQKYPYASRMSYGDGYDNGQIDAYNKSVDQYNTELNNYFNAIADSTTNSQSIFTPRISGSSKNIFSQSPMSMPMSKPSSVQMMSVKAPTFAPMSMPQKSPQMSMPQRSFPTITSGPNQNASPIKSTAKPAILSGPNQNASPIKPKSPAPAPMSYSYKPPMSISKSPAPQSKPTSNVFSSVKSYVNNIFRRK